MKMKKNWLDQKGVSLIEATIAMALTSAAGVAYMTHVQTVAKNEAQQKVRASLTLLESQAMDYLKSKDICNINMNKAFDGMVLTDKVSPTDEPLKGHKDYKSLLGKSFQNSSKVTENKQIFKIDDSFDGDRIWVSDIRYSLDNLETRTIPNSPWNKTGTLLIEVVFEKCANGGPVYRKTPNGKFAACDKIVEHKKIFKKDAAFKVDNTGKIASKAGKVWNPAIQKYVSSGEMVNQAACADSQDALVDEAKDYTDKKICLMDAKLMANSGREGTTSCDYTIKTSEGKIEKTAGSGPLPMPSGDIVVPGSLKYEIIGGGGAGGGAKDDAGTGGKAGTYKADFLPDAVLGTNCNFVVGGGGGGVRKGNGYAGGSSSLSCSSASLNIVVAGGAGGGYDKHNTGGDDNGEPGEKSYYGPGGGSTNGEGNSSPNIGAGGSGGGDDGSGQAGGNGGRGNLVVKWKGVQLFDADGIEISMLTGEPIAARTPASAPSGPTSPLVPRSNPKTLPQSEAPVDYTNGGSYGGGSYGGDYGGSGEDSGLRKQQNELEQVN